MMETILLNNRYRILQTIGRGGFGETFLATDTHMPSERKCVIKQLKPVIQPPEVWVKERFQREAAILEELGETNSQIPRLHAYFAEADNFYLVQEWIEGINLKQKQEKEGVLSEEYVTEILLKLLPVLTYIHNRKIIHRDIKPENIILRQSDRLPVLIDFGAVKEAIITQVHYSTSNSVSISIGTPGYMASEQAAGRPVYSSDLYSLGLTAIYLLTGCTPKDLETDSRTGEILWRQQAPNLHANLASVIDRSIRFHPRDRFASAEEMQKALKPQQEATTPGTQIITPKYPISSQQKREKKEPTTGRTVVVDYPVLEQQNSPIKLIFPLLLAGGITLAAVTLGLSLLRGKDKPTTVSPPSVSVPTIPDLPPLEPHQPGTIEPYANSVPVPEPPIVEPSPTITPEPSPTITPEPQPSQPVARSQVPIFALGTKQAQILDALGEPTTKQRGFWQNTIVWIYPEISNGVEVKYLFDTESEELRQSETIFVDGTSLEVMQDTLNQLLGGEAPESIQAALSEVYQNKTDWRSFKLKNSEGMIRRDTREKINIMIFAADFH